jgi:xanthine dehydrogenase accessory factor
MIPMPHVFIMGGGHCGEAIAGLLDQVAWPYSVHDTREEFSSQQLYPHAAQCITSTVADLMESENENTLKRFSDILLLGHDWAEDQERLLSLLSIFNGAGRELDGEQAPRIGVIGSRSKWQSFEQEALSAGIPQDLLDQVICPIGMNIGAESPEEIAVAVVAQILSAHKGVGPDQPTWRQSS